MRKIFYLLLFISSFQGACQEPIITYDWLQSTPSGDYVDKINSYRTTVDNKVYLQGQSTSRILFSPLSDRYAQFYMYQKETSATDNFYSFNAGGGIAPYYEVKVYGSRTGSWGGAATATARCQAAGGTMTGSFNGTGLEFVHYSNSRGGVWQWIIDGGTPVDVSTWNATDIYEKDLRAIGLVKGNHTYIATFTGSDPLHAPSTSPAWGWACDNVETSSNVSSDVYKKAIYVIGSDNPNHIGGFAAFGASDRDILLPGGNHFDISVSSRPANIVMTQRWFPNHEVTGTASVFASLATDRTLTLDGGTTNYLTESFVAYEFVKTSGLKWTLRQVCKVVNNDAPTNYEYDAVVINEVTSDGFFIDLEMIALQDLLVSAAYTLMPSLPAVPTKMEKMCFDGLEYDNDGVSVPYAQIYTKAQLPTASGDFIGVNVTGSTFDKSLCIGFVADNFQNSLQLIENWSQRLGYAKLITGNVFGLKVYPQIIDNVINVISGSAIHYRGRSTMGLVPDAYATLVTP